MDDTTTINMGRPYGPRVRWMLSRTRWLAPWALWIAALLLCFDAIFMPMTVLMFFLVFLVWLMVILPYAIRGTLRNTAVKIYRQSRSLRRIDRAAAIRINIAFGITGLLALAHPPIYIPFYLSQHWLNRLAEREYAEVPMLAPPDTHWSGLCLVTIVRRAPDGITAIVNGRELLFCPSGQLGEGLSFRSYRPISRGWFVDDPGGPLSQLSLWPRLN